MALLLLSLPLCGLAALAWQRGGGLAWRHGLRGVGAGLGAAGVTLAATGAATEGYAATSLAMEAFCLACAFTARPPDEDDGEGGAGPTTGPRTTPGPTLSRRASWS